MKALKATRIGFIGAGLNAHGHALALRSIIEGPTLKESVELALVYDIDHQKAAVFAEQHGVGAAASDAGELFEEPGLDAVYICTPTASHKSYYLKAAEAGKHIFVEKPLAFTTGDIKEMIWAGKKAGIKAQAGLVLRFEPVFWYLKQLMEQKKDDFGPLLHFTFRSDQEWPLCGSFHDSAWRSDPGEAYAGCLFEHSIHDVDLIRYLFGEVSGLSATVAYRSATCAAGIEDTAAVNLSMENGCSGNLTALWHHIKGRDVRRLEIFFERAAVILDDFKPGDFGARYRELSMEISGQPKRLIPNEEVDAAYHRSIGSPELLSPDVVSPYRYQALAFLQALTGRREPHPCLGEALEAHRIIESVYAYARRHQPLHKIYG